MTTRTLLNLASIGVDVPRGEAEFFLGKVDEAFADFPHFGFCH